ncbi:hypothetical protein F2A31_07130 [Acinetobacter suaedae]|uniref:Uncharacterized protein n=1 Tax=Acinetobacter suaedae TaxID=2609668 RepID=A0A5P1UV39_9GAMM|nr:hypothetical protein [Acinetobacter sp. C16S1]QER39497.1 hypothetical protein F2A31_07130 [Acinetobacter sp. C16S1]
MKIRLSVVALSLLTWPIIAMAEPKFESNISGSSILINASNSGAHAYECVYNYSYNHPQQNVGAYQFSGKLYIEAGARQVAVVTRHTDQVVAKLNFDYKCTQK